MNVVTITSIKVKNNPCMFVDPFRFEITFEASQTLEDDLEWRLTYVGSADSEAYDQVLDSVLVGPVPCGVNRFELEAPAPDVSKIPSPDLLGITVVLLECLYREKIFVRVGYYLNNEDPNAPVAKEEEGQAEEVLGEDEDEDDDDEEEEEEDEQQLANKRIKVEDDVAAVAAAAPPAKPAVLLAPKEIRRTIKEDAPRITRFPIDWDAPATSAPQ